MMANSDQNDDSEAQPDSNGASAKARSLKLAGLLLWFVGLGGIIALVATQGLVEVAAATAVVGWGVVWLGSLQLLPMAADTMGWRQLLRRHASISFTKLLWVRWIGESVNNLLPTARVGGELLRAWLAHRRLGLPGAVASAGVIVDLTAVIAAQFLFTVTGLGLLLSHDVSAILLQGAVLGAAILLAMFVCFLLAQRAVIVVLVGWLTKTVARRRGWSQIAVDTGAFEAKITEIYADRRRLLACVSWHLCAWILGTLEVWLGLWLLDHPVSFLDALMLESLVQAIRGAAFFMPGALGVQEGGFILLGAVVGLGPEVALAISLLKRFRELLLGLPGLVAWQTAGLRRRFQRREARADAGAGPRSNSDEDAGPLR